MTETAGGPVWDGLTFYGLMTTNNVWGGGEVRAGAPAVETVCDVAYAPWSADGRWGIYDSSDRLVEACVDRKFPDETMFLQETAAPVRHADVRARAPDASYVYAGRFHDHFGHFLIEALPRYWWLAREPLAGRKLVIHSEAYRDFFAGSPFARDCFAALGLGPDDFVGFPAPVRLPELVVPLPAMRPQTYVHEVFGDLLRVIGRRMLAGRTLVPNDRPVWLSKSRLAHGVSRVVNEDVVEAVLAANGVDIVHPECLTLAEQIELFATRRVVGGTTGSAFHVSAFVERFVRMVRIDHVSFVNSGLLLFDRVGGQAGEHYHPVGTAVVPDARFMRAVAFPEPQRVGEAIVEILHR